MGTGKGTGRGGARKNAGRPLGTGRHREPTTQVSIPYSKLEEVQAIINDGRQPPKAAKPYPYPIAAPEPGEVAVLKRASAQSVIAAAKQQGLRFKVVLLDPLYRNPDTQGRAQFAAECIPLVAAAAQISEHIFIFGWTASLGAVAYSLPRSLELREWLIWYIRNIPADKESWRPAHQSCLHLSKPGAKLYPQNLYRPVDLPLASFTRLKHHTRPYNVICAGNIHGSIVNKTLGTRPGEKPAKLIDVLLRMTMNPGDLVLDPTCCTGTIGEVAISNNYGAVLSDRSAPALKHTTLRLALAREKLAMKQAKYSRLMQRWKNKAKRPAKAAQSTEKRKRKESAIARNSRTTVQTAGKTLAEIESRLIRGLATTGKQKAAIWALAEEVFGSEVAARNWMTEPAIALNNHCPIDLINSCQGAIQTGGLS